jgi:hypothetical protein
MVQLFTQLYVYRCWLRVKRMRVEVKNKRNTTEVWTRLSGEETTQKG